MPKRRPKQPNKTTGRTALWYWTLGWFGAHHYYLRDWPRGIGYSLSIGGFFILWLRDMSRLTDLTRAANQDLNQRYTAQNTATIADNTTPR